MKTLSLLPSAYSMKMAIVDGEHLRSTQNIQYSNFDNGDTETTIKHLSQALQAFAKEAKAGGPSSIAIRVITGKDYFSGPVFATAENRKCLSELAHYAPLHIPTVLWLLQACDDAFPDISPILVFETAFFKNLPKHESLYALNLEAQRQQKICRFGYHGIFHEAAALSVKKELQNTHTNIDNLRILSICMERHPEVSGIYGLHPLTISSGTTPLEGIPGEKSCGQIDPGIPSVLSEYRGWSPEQVNDILTRESGLRGLVGYDITFEELFNKSGEQSDNLQLAKDVIHYTLLQYSAMSVCALEGLDAVVVSGCYCNTAYTLAEKILPALLMPGEHSDRNILIQKFDKPLEILLASYANSIMEGIT